MARATLLQLCLAIGLLTGLPLAVAGPAAERSDAGYTRLLHDCGDDYGAHTGALDQSHDLVALDVIETAVGGQPMVVLSLVMDEGNAAPFTERLTLLVDGRVHAIELVSENGETFSAVRGEGLAVPAHVSAKRPMPAEGSDEQDGTRFFVELGLTYEQLELANGDEIEVPRVQALHSGGRGDYMPGGWYNALGIEQSACPLNATGLEQGYHRGAAYVVQHSNWRSAHADPDPDPQQTPERVPPTAEMTIAPMEPVVGHRATFRDASSDDGALVAWEWHFGDGASAATKDASHAYTLAGAYTVSLTVVNDQGLSAQAFQEITVVEGPAATLTGTTEPGQDERSIETPPPGVVGIVVALAVAGSTAALARRASPR